MRLPVTVERGAAGGGPGEGWRMTPSVGEDGLVRKLFAPLIYDFLIGGQDYNDALIRWSDTPRVTG